jgi:hypothetical protein
MVDPVLHRMSQSRTPPETSTSRSHGHFQSVTTRPTSAPYFQTRFQDAFSDPSQSKSSFEPFNYNFGCSAINMEASLSSPSMRPPQVVVDSMHKRYKSSHGIDSPATTLSEAYSPYTGPLDPYNLYMAMPLTPISPDGSGEPTSRTASQQRSPATPDLRRMSVRSIINNDLSEHSQDLNQRRQYPFADFSATTYGYDLGLADLDTPNNDDYSAINIFSPRTDTMEFDDETTYGSADPRSKDMAFESGGYYAKPVAIRISKSLGALPPVLMKNPMNLLYFHYFLNHTARILVPHDCERNPFRQILPESK